MANDEVPVRLALQAVSFAHKGNSVRNFKDCTHLVLAVAITPCGTTCHRVDCLGDTALLANGFCGGRKVVVMLLEGLFNLES